MSTEPLPTSGDPAPSPALASVRARLATLLGLPLPTEPAPPARLDPGRRGAAALLALAVAALAVTAFVVWRGRPRPVVVAPPPVTVSTPSAPAASLVVDVAGDVRRPGLVRLAPGARVADALRAAGGVRPGASTLGLNLARKVVDGEQILVGAAAPGAPAAAAAAQASGPLNLNTATADQLDELPGIGPVLADRIVEWRTAHGPFTSVDQLREVSGIGARKFESIRELVTV